MRPEAETLRAFFCGVFLIRKKGMGRTRHKNMKRPILRALFLRPHPARTPAEKFAQKTPGMDWKRQGGFPNAIRPGKTENCKKCEIRAADPRKFLEKNPHGRRLPPAVRTLRTKSPGGEESAQALDGNTQIRRGDKPAKAETCRPVPLRPFPIFAAPGMRLPPQRPAGAGGRRTARPHTEKPGQRGLRKKSRPLQESPGLRITKQGVQCASPARAPGETPGLHTAGAGGPQEVSAAPRQSARFKKNARQNANYA